MPEKIRQVKPYVHPSGIYGVPARKPVPGKYNNFRPFSRFRSYFPHQKLSLKAGNTDDQAKKWLRTLANDNRPPQYLSTISYWCTDSLVCTQLQIYYKNLYHERRPPR